MYVSIIPQVRTLELQLIEKAKQEAYREVIGILEEMILIKQ